MLIFRWMVIHMKEKNSRFYGCTNTKYIQISWITGTTAYIQIFVRIIVSKP